MKKRGVFNTCTCTVTNTDGVDVDARQRLPCVGTTGPVYVYSLSCFRCGIYTLSRPLRCCSKRTRCTGSAFCPRIREVELSNENIERKRGIATRQSSSTKQSRKHSRKGTVMTQKRGNEITKK